jgi:hypothetical protein
MWRLIKRTVNLICIFLLQGRCEEVFGRQYGRAPSKPGRTSERRQHYQPTLLRVRQVSLEMRMACLTELQWRLEVRPPVVTTFQSNTRLTAAIKLLNKIQVRALRTAVIVSLQTPACSNGKPPGSKTLLTTRTTVSRTLFRDWVKSERKPYPHV